MPNATEEQAFSSANKKNGAIKQAPNQQSYRIL
jgi:hypothetical protein